MNNGSLWHSVPIGPSPPERFYVIVETPRGSKCKYEISKSFPGIILDRVLHHSVMFPAEYGLIPRTYYLDDDPMDVILLMSQQTYPGIIVEAKPIGMLEMIDQEKHDNKILAAAVNDPIYRNYEKIEDLPEHLPKEIANFFEIYKILEHKETRVLGWKDKETAKVEINRSIAMYNEKFGH
ncbi:MAG: inorganic diphosphatase [Candidatus Thermoplasmatota archaeon]|nr:inorganic diphosphatase [Candidatus Thermoplasmatota archaeon]